jgi:hypothetical protein
VHGHGAPLLAEYPLSAVGPYSNRETGLSADPKVGHSKRESISRIQLLSYAVRCQLLMRNLLLAGTALVFSVLDIQPLPANAQTRVRQPIRSIANTHGCPCPYDQVIREDGVIYRCGDASAWSRSGGRTPTCYVNDILYGGDMGGAINTQLNCTIDFTRCQVLN